MNELLMGYIIDSNKQVCDQPAASVCVTQRRGTAVLTMQLVYSSPAHIYLSFIVSTVSPLLQKFQLRSYYY